MTRDLLRHRLHNQQLSRPRFSAPAEIVAWLGAVQAQDYAGARWGLGLRANGLADHAVEQAFDRGAILRTHVLRPTWHFVTPADIRWMLALTAPRVHAANAFSYRTLELDRATVARSRTVFERALGDGGSRTRAELAADLRRAGIHADGLRLGYFAMHAELEGVICSGPRRGKQFTYALLDARAPLAKTLARQEALVELARRYFSSHGPATVRDFSWWSGLTIREARSGLDAIAPSLVQETRDDRTYWFTEGRPAKPPASPAVYLLPNYDEYLIAYRDRELARPVSEEKRIVLQRPDEYAHLLVIDGRLAGVWRRRLERKAVHLELVPYRRLTRAETTALAAAAERYGRFIGLPVVLST